MRYPGTPPALRPDDAASALLASVVPGSVSVAAVRTDVRVALAVAEAAAVHGAVPARRREFATGRGCARAALAGLAGSVGPDQPTHRRRVLAAEPLSAAATGGVRWPVGVVGSITHCAGFRGAAVAWATGIGGTRAVGIDAEPAQELPDPLVHDVLDASELSVLSVGRTYGSALPWTRIAFCAKEALYKLWSPTVGGWLGFEDAEVTAVELSAPHRGAIRLGLRVRALRVGAGFPPSVAVRFAVADGVIVAGATLPTVAGRAAPDYATSRSRSAISAAATSGRSR